MDTHTLPRPKDLPQPRPPPTSSCIFLPLPFPPLPHPLFLLLFTGNSLLRKSDSYMLQREIWKLATHPGPDPFRLLHVGVGCTAPSSPPSPLSRSLCMSCPFPPQVLPTAGPGTRIRCLQSGPLSHQNFATCHER